MHYQDYYTILGVPRDAGADEIRKAFRKLARKYHPDVSREADAEARMKEVNEAYAVLSDPDRRAAYDQLGEGYRGGQEFRPPPGWDEGYEFSGHGFTSSEAADFSDFFSELFGRMGHGEVFGMHGARFGGQGEDHHAKVYLDLEDAFHGATRQLTLNAPALDAGGRLAMRSRTLNVKIPKGLCEGQVIRLAGQGSPPPQGGRPGDLLLEVHFKPHPRLRAEGRDLHLTLPVAPWEAALGAVVAVALPDSEIRVRVPEGSQSGRQLRVRGKGLPGQPPGDLLLDLRVVVPPADSARARELYQDMARELAFDPRREN